ncbi:MULTISPECIES: AbrB/MazE/SpoVT family DNA-binding domain-containing protein [Rhizobium/Agrobacterium group]|uniref:Antitoxin MazE n=1 Tax=Rhizobium soli TaxID=424798 RepID=A0A7X0JIU9_9HYPH|nr:MULTISPECIES: AbrB/MazE/SpoVT family DNA-binding domain-containing protein [Rhizobium/Agrobacterium group]KQQ70948.1 PbsX family transcriptional regulator [Rhizobium sp. Leaf321]MBB6508358.1 antitoxin MazE [Rhizobium soli]NSY17106.1 AbrB/MazE/SpoVT family DNA-binding domain-containing protein [Neorhizobium sp. AL 9.2.2]
MRVTVKKSGDSASVRIPAAVMEAANLKPDSVVEVSEENGRIVIQAVTELDTTLDHLVAGMNADNLHDEADFGAPVGREAL